MSITTMGKVFLTHSPTDQAAASQVKKRLGDKGIVVQTVHALPTKDLATRMRNALAESEAFVVLATEASVHSTDLAFEIGAARGLQKPIFVLTKDIAKSDLPPYLREFSIIPYESLEKLAGRIHSDNDSE